MSEKPEGWAAKLVDLFGRPLSRPFSELTGILDDYVRVARYRNRVKLIKELEADGLLPPAGKGDRQLIFRGSPKGDAEGEDK